jgi:hypothetical protein
VGQVGDIMISRENSGDFLASEFMKKLREASELRKKASAEYSENDAHCASEADTQSSDEAKDQEQANDTMDSEISDNVLENMLADSDVENDTYDAAYDDMVDDFKITAEQERVMRGLGKIAGSLRKKNEMFAADVVEATAINIRNDFYKKANKKQTVIEGLNKIASSLSQKGEEFAADVVKATINKIAKS